MKSESATVEMFWKGRGSFFCAYIDHIFPLKWRNRQKIEKTTERKEFQMREKSYRSINGSFLTKKEGKGYWKTYSPWCMQFSSLVFNFGAGEMFWYDVCANMFFNPSTPFALNINHLTQGNHSNCDKSYLYLLNESINCVII